MSVPGSNASEDAVHTRPRVHNSPDTIHKLFPFIQYTYVPPFWEVLVAWVCDYCLAQPHEREADRQNAGPPGKFNAWAEAKIPRLSCVDNTLEENPLPVVYPSVRVSHYDARHLIAVCPICGKWCYMEHTERDPSDMWCGRQVRFFDKQGNELERWDGCSSSDVAPPDWCTDCMKSVLQGHELTEQRRSLPRAARSGLWGNLGSTVSSWLANSVDTVIVATVLIDGQFSSYCTCWLFISMVN